MILAVGSVWQSAYELYAHEAVGRKAGLSDDAVQALAAGAVSEELSDEEKVAQRFATQLTAERRVEAATYTAAEQAFGEQGFVEITYLTGIYHIVCALLNAFEIPAPDRRA